MVIFVIFTFNRQSCFLFLISCRPLGVFEFVTSPYLNHVDVGHFMFSSNIFLHVYLNP